MDGSEPGYRGAFLEALRLLERAFALAQQRGACLPVIVGGAAVEYHTMSAVQSGDFDLAEGDEDLVGQALLAVGFRKEDRQGHILRGFYLVGADFEVGVEFVSGALFDGRTERKRLELVQLSDDGLEVLRFPPVEDMIADRLAQYEASPNSHADMLEQARLLWRLADELDFDYLVKRVRDEIGPADWQRLLGKRDA